MTPRGDDGGDPCSGSSGPSGGSGPLGGSRACRLPLALLGGANGSGDRRGRPSNGDEPDLRVGPAGPAARYEYSPPADGGQEAVRSCTSCCPPSCRCPTLPCAARARELLQACAEGVGAWPSGRWLSSLLCPCVLLLQAWALAYCFLGDAARPDGHLFRLAAMFVCASLAGWLVRKVADIPALVGMLVVGVAMKSTGYLGVTDAALVAGLRKTALVLIMIRAGLGLDPSMLRTLSLHVLGLAIVPATVEVATVTVLAHFLLDLPWLWGVLLGLVLAAVAPSVVMPCFTELRAQRLGVDKGIDTLVVAAASFDDVIAISLYGLVQSLVFGEGFSAQELVQHPLGLIYGILFGAALGKALQIVPTRDAAHAALWRFVLVLGGGLVVTFGSEALGFHEAGSVGCISTALTAAAGWRSREAALSVKVVEQYFDMVWAVFEPIMFSLIGADIDTGVLDGSLVGLAVGCILISLLFRTLATWLLLFANRSFNWKERLFVALAWLPKADVQAALGPLALDAARQIFTEAENEARGHAVLLVAVLSILITAPAGAVIISALSRRLLTPVPPPPSAPRQLEGGRISCGV